MLVMVMAENVFAQDGFLAGVSNEMVRRRTCIYTCVCHLVWFGFHIGIILRM